LTGGHSISAQASGGSASGRAPVAERAFAAVRTDFAEATETVFDVMAGIMAALDGLAHLWLPHGRAVTEEPGAADARGEAAG
jgi:hypothetical protein